MCVDARWWLETEPKHVAVEAEYICVVCWLSYRTRLRIVFVQGVSHNLYQTLWCYFMSFCSESALSRHLCTLSLCSLRSSNLFHISRLLQPESEPRPSEYEVSDLSYRDQLPHISCTPQTYLKENKIMVKLQTCVLGWFLGYLSVLFQVHKVMQRCV